MAGLYGTICAMAVVPNGDGRLPEVRVSDADRGRVVDLLREHCGAGRLTITEFEERTSEAYAARTLGQLDHVLRELPVPPSQRPVRPAPRDVDAGFRGHLNVYLVVNIFLVFIWAVTGAGYFWPMWPAAGWGVALALHWLGSRGDTSPET